MGNLLHITDSCIAIMDINCQMYIVMQVIDESLLDKYLKLLSVENDFQVIYSR